MENENREKIQHDGSQLPDLPVMMQNWSASAIKLVEKQEFVRCNQRKAKKRNEKAAGMSLSYKLNS